MKKGVMKKEIMKKRITKKRIREIKNTERAIRNWPRIILFTLVILFVAFFVIGLLYIINNELKKENETPEASFWLNKSCIMDLGRQECKNIGKQFLSAEINQFIFYSGIFTCLNDSSSWIYIQITKEQIDNCLINAS